MMRERGTILFAVLVVLAIGSLVGTSVLLSVDAERNAGDGVRRRDQARALAWSGVQAVMSELEQQRESLLAGGAPGLTGAWVLFIDDLGRQGVVRLLPLGEHEVDSAMSESGKLDLNHATVDMIEALGIVDRPTAEDIVAARARRPFASVEELLRVPGVTREMVYGGGFDLRIDPFAEVSRGSIVGSEAPPTFIRLATVFAFDPNVIAGAGDLARSRGTERLNLNTRWSPQLGRAIARVWDDDVARGVGQVMQSGIRFTRDSDIVRAMRQFNVEIDMWAMVLDSFCTSDDAYRLGRVDIMHAPREVLAAIPGISDEAAEQIVSQREQISDVDRPTAVWLVARGILTAEEFEQAVNWITVRSLQWRVRIEVGTTLAASASEGGAADRLEEAALQDRMVWEAVIDVASQRPRVAYLRDITMMEASRALADRWLASGDLSPDDSWAPSFDIESRPALETASGTARADRPRMDRSQPSIAESREARAAERTRQREERLAPRTPSERPTAGRRNEAGNARTAPASDQNRDAAVHDDEAPISQVDRRIGRWRGSGGSQ
ncbi:MAG: helix-hairpin-helix domain-containing protein [Phycisphaeraceae bacterium]|nr:helix-hairpin-helix domain-containing protein [Phycisphaeraceae bacterium]MCW5753333.1 helix-hairpin-helix domain-containing protein [Phycisphaeraceae bacterium]